jgi:hypothetical protein
LAKRRVAEKVDDEEELLENKEMFMSVKDFQDRMVVIPEFGRKKKSASSMHQDVEQPAEPEKEEEQREDEGTDQEEVDEEEEEGDEEEEGEEEDPDKFCNRECYAFNVKLEAGLDDKCCKHCKLYLTLQCPHISEFMDEVEEGDVD